MYFATLRLAEARSTSTQITLIFAEFHMAKNTLKFTITPNANDGGTKTSNLFPYTYAPSYSAQCSFYLIFTILDFPIRAKPREFHTHLPMKHLGGAPGEFRDTKYCDTSAINENVWRRYAIQLDAFIGCSLIQVVCGFP